MKALKSGGAGMYALLFILAALIVTTPGDRAAASGDPVSTKEIRQETRELIQALKSYSIERRDEAVRETKTALEDLDERIEKLEARIDDNWDKMDKALREKARASLKALRKQRTLTAEWFGSLKSSSAEAWGHTKKGFSDAYQALQNAWESSKEEFGSGK